MDNSTVPYLCGGTFFILLEHAKKPKKSITNANLLEHLIKQFKPDFKLSLPNDSFTRVTSQYRSCQISKSMYLPFDQDLYIKSFDQKIRSDYNLALKNMEEFIQLFLDDSEMKMIRLTKALLELLEQDISISESVEFYCLETGAAISKKELLNTENYCVSALMLGIWHFIILNRDDNAKGRETFENWNEQGSVSGTKWIFKSTIGSEYNRQITAIVFSKISNSSETADIKEKPSIDIDNATTGKNNKSIRFKLNKSSCKYLSKKQICVIAVTIAALSLILVLAFQVSSYSSYNQKMKTADQARHNGNYIDAANRYHSAKETARKLLIYKNLYLKAYCREGDSYLLAGINSDDQNYYAHAFGIYGDVMDNHKFESSEYYIDALCGLSATYMYTGHICNSKWNTVIEKIFNQIQSLPQIDFNSDLNDSDQELLTHWLKISFALNGYYQTAIKTDYTVSNTLPVLQNALYYNHVYTTILNLLSKDNLELSYYNDYTSDTIYTVQLLVLLANNLQVENADKYANQAINICEKELKRLSLNEYDISTYISLKYLISASNVALGNFYSDNKILSESYLKTAHDELISLLDLCKENVPIEQKTDIAYQVLFTKKCTANDLQKILEVYQELFNQINVSEDPKQAANWALNICAACKYVNDTYGFSSQFWKIGQAVTELVIEDYIQNTQKEVYGSFKDYFHPDINTNTESLFP